MRALVLLLLTTFFIASCNEKSSNDKGVTDQPQKRKVNHPIKLERKKQAVEVPKSIKTSNQAVKEINKLPELKQLIKNNKAELSVFTEDEDANKFTVVVDQEKDMTSVEMMRFEVNKSGEIFAYDIETGELLPLKKWQKRYKSLYGRK